MSFDVLSEHVSIVKLILSAALLLALVALRTFANQALRRVTRADVRRRWLVTVRNATILLAILGMVSIWAEALRPFAVSILAVAVAFVIATKELIQSALGSVLRSAANLYSIGDRIEIGSQRGDVIDVNLFTTTIMEVGPGKAFHMRTGRTISFPNNKILDASIVNESYTKDYVIHALSVPLKAEHDWKKAEAILLEAAHAECGPYLEEAKLNMKSLRQAQALNGLAVHPRVAIQLGDPGKLSLLLRFPVPVGHQGRVEQAIIRRFLDHFYSASGNENMGEAAVVPKPAPALEFVI